MKVDMPADAPAQYVRWIEAVLDPLIAIIEGSEVTRLNVAISAAGLSALHAEGFTQIIERIRLLAAEGRIELMGTAAHGALLPLLPPEEIGRQIDLNDQVNRRYFGDAYHPASLWPPALAFAHKVAEVAASRDFTSILVDEAAMRIWPSRWPGDRIDYIEGLPGVFLLPRSRRGSRAFENGAIHSHADLLAFSCGELSQECYLITAVDLTPRSAPSRALLFTMDEARTVRLEQMFNYFPLSHPTSPLPCSENSTAEELGHGLPFAPWFSPGNKGQAMRWRLMTMQLEALKELESKGLQALPATKALRDAIDRGWREQWWRLPLGLGVPPLRRALQGVRDLVLPTLAQEAFSLMDALEVTEPKLRQPAREARPEAS